MHILIVCSGNHDNLSPFIREQVESIERNGVLVSYFFIKGKGFFGYLNNYRTYKKSLDEIKPDIVHAHFGLSGLFACLNFRIPVVITFHGSDVTNKLNRLFSLGAFILSKRSIFVSQTLSKLLFQKNATIIPCGVDINTFKPQDKVEAKLKMGFDSNKNFILFTSNFDNKIKNYPLAKASVDMIGNDDTVLVELNGYNRDDVCTLLNAVDCLLMTSDSEGSPQVIKEALACNCPIISTKVGDVPNLLLGIDGCYVVDREPSIIANRLQQVLSNNYRIKGRDKILEQQLDLMSISIKIQHVYNGILKK